MSDSKVIGFAGGSQTLLDQYGKPMDTAINAKMRLMNQALRVLKQQVVRARYDAAQTFTGNELHWGNADRMGPNMANRPEIRATLRSRSRYEIIENNPYLKGTILSIANDFVGSGPRLEIVDKRLSKERKKMIEDAWDHWCKVRKIRRKLWRLRIAKIVDGEGFMIAYSNPYGQHPVQLDYQVIEADQVSSQFTTPSPTIREVDGVRFDAHENPLAYHILHYHPGDAYLSPFPKQPGGDWVDSRLVIHWFRQDRGWMRGIPELTPSLPLCALLRRYTLATVRHAETAADLTGIIETQGLPNTNPFTDADGVPLDDEPFNTFPVEAGELMNLPRGYALKQLNPVPLGAQFDEFVGAILREITRPILVPHNLAAGTSKDSNMASGVLDESIYKNGQKAERMDCESEVMDKMFHLWWLEASLIPDLTRNPRKPQRGRTGRFYSDQEFKIRPIERKWRWDKVGIDHTDPAKIAQALQILLDKKILTDRQVQEEYFNRDYEDWQEEVKAEEDFRLTLPSEKMEKIDSKKPKPAVGPGASGNKGNKKAQSSTSKSSNRNRSKSKQPRRATASK